MTLNLQLHNGVPTTVKIFSVDGKLQRQLQVQHSKTSIDLSFLNKGTYIVALSNAVRYCTSKLFIS
jgi:hypothetical protein